MATKGYNRSITVCRDRSKHVTKHKLLKARLLRGKSCLKPMRAESVEEPILSKSMKKVVFVETVLSI